jgi:nucleoside-diphosphate-sugar epimerase
MSKFLLTGAGYVGSAIINAHKYGNQIKVLDNGYKPLDHLGLLLKDISFYSGDICNEDDVARAMEGVDFIIHTAAIVGFPECKEKPELAEKVNIKGTETLLKVRDRLYSKTPPRFVYCSTGSVYGKLEETCTEDSPCNPLSLYGITKLKAENLVSSVENSVSLRFATGCGISPKMRFNTLVNELCYDAFYDGELVIAEPDAKRTFIDVYDMAHCLMVAGMNWSDHIGKVYNAGSDELNLTKKQIAEIIKDKTGCEVKYDDFIIDMDKRDYSVNYSKFKRDFGTGPQYSIDNIVDNLLAYMPIFKNRKTFLQ